MAFSRRFPIFGFKIINESSSPEDPPYLESFKLSNRCRHHPLFWLNSNLYLNYFPKFAAQESALPTSNNLYEELGRLRRERVLLKIIGE
jgi:hypothetical protein